MKTLGRIDLLILEDLGLVPLSVSYQPLLLELLEDRQQREVRLHQFSRERRDAP